MQQCTKLNLSSSLYRGLLPSLDVYRNIVSMYLTYEHTHQRVHFKVGRTLLLTSEGLPIIYTSPYKDVTASAATDSLLLSDFVC